jgi:quercetin dioxygenase-like cupin family protein
MWNSVKRNSLTGGICRKVMIQMGICFSLIFLMSIQAMGQDGMHDKGPDDPIIVLPGEIEWKDGPASFEEGSQMAVLEGNPAEAGFFNMKLKLPDGFRISPHWHPRVERVTVISGTFLLGHGENFDRDAAKRLVAGSYFSMPPEMVHYAVAEGETIVQLTTIGPWDIIYVNPEDDPRKR